jgi:hypothetical protein
LNIELFKNDEFSPEFISDCQKEGHKQDREMQKKP